MTDSTTMAASEVITDPVGHISISGVHGGDELNDRIAHADRGGFAGRRDGTRTVLLGVAIGLVVGMLIGRGMRRRSQRAPLTTP